MESKISMVENKKITKINKTINSNYKIFALVLTLLTFLSYLPKTVSAAPQYTYYGARYAPVELLTTKYYIAYTSNFHSGTEFLITSDKPLYIIPRNTNQWIFSTNADVYENDYELYEFYTDGTYFHYSRDDNYAWTDTESIDYARDYNQYMSNHEIGGSKVLLRNDGYSTETSFPVDNLPFDLIKDKYYYAYKYKDSLWLAFASSPLKIILEDGYYHVLVSSDNTKAPIYKYNSETSQWVFTPELSKLEQVDKSLISDLYYDKLYVTNHNLDRTMLYEFVKNDSTVKYPSSDPEETPPQTPVTNDKYFNINGETLTYENAMLNELIKSNFILTLLLIVTVVFFVINKFWSWIRRLFTVKI